MAILAPHHHDPTLESVKKRHRGRERTMKCYKLPGIPASCRPSSTAVWPMCESVYQGYPENNNTTNETHDPTYYCLQTRTSGLRRTLPFLSFFQTDLDFPKISKVENFFINLEFFSLFMLMSFQLCKNTNTHSEDSVSKHNKNYDVIKFQQFMVSEHIFTAIGQRLLVKKSIRAPLDGNISRDFG